MIVRNEAKLIERALTSALPFIDSYSIVDTGSTDDTKAIIAAFMDKHGIRGGIFDRPWVDFGHNRTEAINLARGLYPNKHGLILDADDTIEVDDGFELPEPLLLDQYDNVVVFTDGSTTSQPHVIRLSKPFFFGGSTHEALDCHTFVLKGPIEGMRYRIFTDGANRVDKFKRDIAYLLKDIEKEPLNARAHYYLAQSYRDDGDQQAAYEAFLKRAEMSGWDEETWSAKLEAAKCAERLGMSDFEIAGRYLDAHESRPQRAEALYHVGRFFRQAENYVIAVLFSEAASRIPLPKGDRLFVEESIYQWRAQAEFAISAHYVGRRQDATLANMAALSKAPIGEHAWILRNMAHGGPSKTSLTLDGPMGPFEIPAAPDATRRCCEGIAREVWAGEYAHAELPKTGIEKILDIGAGWGAVTVWALKEWPDAEIDCYEPHAPACEYLRHNAPTARVHEVAVTVQETALLAVGGPNSPDNWGALTVHGVTSGKPVAVLHPKDLPPCDLLKIDAELVEPEIVENYPHLAGVKVLLYEFHNADHRKRLREFCERAGFRCLREVQTGSHDDFAVWGPSIWVRATTEGVNHVD